MKSVTCVQKVISKKSKLMTNEIIEYIFKSLLNRYQNNLELSIRVSDFTFNCVNLLYYMFCMLKKETIYPAYVSKHESNCGEQVTLVIITNGEGWHYLAVKSHQYY